MPRLQNSANGNLPSCCGGALPFVRLRFDQGPAASRDGDYTVAVGASCG